MKAITIKQPWATLICTSREDDITIGIKPIENRTWPCPPKYIGHRVLVHASAKPVSNFKLLSYLTDEMIKESESVYRNGKFTDGAIIGSVEIVDCVVNHPSVWAEKTEKQHCKFGACKYDQIECKIDCKLCKHITKPTYNWVLANPIKFPEPITAKGKLSFWDYPNILAEQEEKNGELFCHCNIHIDEKIQVMALAGDYTCRYCGGHWYK